MLRVVFISACTTSPSLGLFRFHVMFNLLNGPCFSRIVPDEGLITHSRARGCLFYRFFVCSVCREFVKMIRRKMNVLVVFFIFDKPVNANMKVV